MTAIPSPEGVDGAADLAGHAITVIQKGPENWTTGDELFMLALAPRRFQDAANRFMVVLDRVYGKNDDRPARLWLRRQLASSIDLRALANPTVHESWLIGLKTRWAEASLARQIERKAKELR